jgi:hypothetical protein
VGNILSLNGAAIEDPLELDNGGNCEDDQMRAGPTRTQWRGSKMLQENKISWFSRNCYGAL